MCNLCEPSHTDKTRFMSISGSMRPTCNTTVNPGESCAPQFERHCGISMAAARVRLAGQVNATFSAVFKDPST